MTSRDSLVRKQPVVPVASPLLFRTYSRRHGSGQVQVIQSHPHPGACFCNQPQSCSVSFPRDVLEPSMEASKTSCFFSSQGTGKKRCRTAHATWPGPCLKLDDLFLDGVCCDKAHRLGSGWMYPTSQAEHPEIQLFKSWIRFIINFPIIIHNHPPQKAIQDYHHLPSMFHSSSNFYPTWMGPYTAARLHRASLANAVGALDGLKSWFLSALSGWSHLCRQKRSFWQWQYVKMMVKNSWGINKYIYICMYVESCWIVSTRFP